jgi:hypothetical protein
LSIAVLTAIGVLIAGCGANRGAYRSFSEVRKVFVAHGGTVDFAYRQRLRGEFAPSEMRGFSDYRREIRVDVLSNPKLDTRKFGIRIVGLQTERRDQGNVIVVFKSGKENERFVASFLSDLATAQHGTGS